MSASLSLTNAQTEERVFENAIPKEVPLKVSLKKEKEQSFKALTNEKWVQELEMEVTNTGEKPIYYLALVLETNVDGGPVLVPDSVRNGRVGLDVRYGSDDFGDIVTKARADDIPIKPGETHILTVDSREAQAWEMFIHDGIHPQATKVKLIMQIITFGDGTGLWGTGGAPYPPDHKRQ
ncbi:MAG TPA: hypothetical protein DC047_09685 [Blastocatellia bacterium]|nr:hypothetical protein [Blastocatellia bacterium]